MISCAWTTPALRRALADRELGRAVARHKTMFFSEKAADRSVIGYRRAVGGALRLMPEAAARDALAKDYAQMVQDGLLLEEAEPFEALTERCGACSQSFIRSRCSPSGPGRQ